MNALYTAYILVEYDRTNEGDYHRRVYSIDCCTEELAFLTRLLDSASLGNADSILQVAIHHSSTLARTPPDEHFESVEKLMIHFNSVHFKKKKE